jgi:anhydro-N-acetylmuramic acid kinase
MAPAQPDVLSEPRPLLLVGLMSGTSLDGISAAVVRFRDADDGRTSFELIGMSVSSYASERRARLARALAGATAEEYCRLSFDLGSWLADAAIAAIAEAGVSRADVAAIAMHGQTVWHVPGHSTWQFGDPSVVAERTGLDVISNFRERDMAAGGQGAPLVPIADAHLFASPVAWRALQNVGGIGNVTVTPPGGGVSGTRAFDTGPGVVVIDGVVRMLAPELPYDVDGALARSGTPIESVVVESLAEPYFASPPPKSTGRELFSAEYVHRFIERCRSARPEATVEDIVATAVRLTARSIADAYQRFLPEPVSEVALSGGGAKNPALVDALRGELAPRTVLLFDDLFFDGEAKEAVAFAFLGYLHLRARPGNIPAATGARGERVLGRRTPA